MSFWPDGFDPRSPTARTFFLCDIDAPSGLARFLIGQDGRFRDVNGHDWWGSQAVEVGPVEISRATRAPEAQIEFSWFPDPNAPDLIEALRETGDDAIAGARVRFYLQPLASAAEFSAPVFAPVLFATRTAGGITLRAPDAFQRSISVVLESIWASRRALPGLTYTPPDYQLFLGSPTPRNPSLDLMPVQLPGDALVP